MATLAGKKVGGTGYGLMNFTWRAKPVPESQAFEAMSTAFNQGLHFWNGGEFYGTPDYNSLHLLKNYFAKHPEQADKVAISIKGAVDPDSHKNRGDREGVQKSVDECLRVLGDTKKLDLFECARVAPDVPVEESIRTLAEYISQGKLGGISLSECSASTIRRAVKVHKIDAVEQEFSFFATEILENGVAAACAENNIPIIAYSPLGRGFLSGQFKTIDDLPEGDIRRKFPRFQPGNFEKNMDLAREVEAVAKKKGCTVGQVALAWIRAKGQEPGMPKIIPIPGGTTAERVQENSKEVTLTAEEMRELEALVKKAEVAGDRYPEFAAGLVFGDSPPEK